MAGAIPEFTDSETGPRAGSDPAIKISSALVYELRLPPRKDLFNAPEITDYQSRPVESLVLQVTCTTASLIAGTEINAFEVRRSFLSLEMQGPDEDNPVVWEPLQSDSYPKWYVEKIAIVEIGAGASRLQLAVKSWGQWADLT